MNFNKIKAVIKLLISNNYYIISCNVKKDNSNVTYSINNTTTLSHLIKCLEAYHDEFVQELNNITLKQQKAKIKAETIEKRNRHYSCKECGVGYVSLNQDECFECDNCDYFHNPNEVKNA